MNKLFLILIVFIMFLSCQGNGYNSKSETTQYKKLVVATDAQCVYVFKYKGIEYMYNPRGGLLRITE